MRSNNPTLQAIDLLIEDFGIEGITAHFRDVFKNHLRESEGYDHGALADEYEIGTRVIQILEERVADKAKRKRIRVAKRRRRIYEKARKEQERKEG